MVQPGEHFAQAADGGSGGGAAQRRATKATTGQRLAGALLVFNALLQIPLMLLAAHQPDPAGLSPAVYVGSALFDAAIGITLVTGQRALVPLAIVRASLGLVVFTALYAVKVPLAAVFQVLACAGLLLLLVKSAGRGRIAAGVVVFGLYLAGCSVVLAAQVLGQFPLATVLMRASGTIEPLASSDVRGRTSPYGLSAPPGGRWYARTAAAAQKDNPLADLWLIRPDLDAHVMVIAEQAPGSVFPTDKYADQVLENARKASKRFVVKSRQTLGSLPENARLARASAEVQGMELEYAFGAFAFYERAYQVVAWCKASNWPKVGSELEAIVASFQPPPGLLDPPPPPEVELAAAGHVIGLSYPYTIDAPSDRWHLRKDEIVKKGNPLIDRWLMRHDRDAHVFVVAEYVKGAKLPIEAYVDAVLDNLRHSSTSLQVLSREPLGSNPETARIVHLTTEIEGKKLEYYFAMFVAPERGFQVAAFAPQSLFASVEPELRRAVESFRLPAQKK